MSVDREGQGAVIRLDHDSIRLLDALHRGNEVGLNDVPDLHWHVRDRIVIPMRLYDDDRIFLVDKHSNWKRSGRIIGQARPLDDRPAGDNRVRLSAGILLIRHGLARRKGYALLITDRGRAISEPRTRHLVQAFEYPARVPFDGIPPQYEILDGQIPVQEMGALEAEQRLAIGSEGAVGDLRSMITITAFAAGNHVVGYLTRDDATAVLKLLAGEDGEPVTNAGSYFQIKPENDPHSFTIDIMQNFARHLNFDRALIRLRPPAAKEVARAIDRAIDSGEETIVEPAAVAYASFDATLAAD